MNIPINTPQDLLTLMAVFTAIITIVGGLVQALATYWGSRSNVKNTARQIDIQARLGDSQVASTQAGAANQMLNIQLSTVQYYSAELERVNQKTHTLEDENAGLKVLINSMRIARDTAISAIKKLMEDHQELYNKAGATCIYFSQLQGQILKILTDLSKDGN